MRTSAQIILDSVSPLGIRFTTIQVCFPRCMLPEFNTHRKFSRNFRSSRAVPVKRLIEEVRTNPYEPARWLRNKPGMQGTEPLSPAEVRAARAEWLAGAREAADRAEKLAACELHKQWANRPIEPYLYVHGVVSATDWMNFNALREHGDAQPEMFDLAQVMREATATSRPRQLGFGEWHLPYITEDDWNSAGYHVGHLSGYIGDEVVELLRKVSAARCARVSFKTFEGKRPSITEDLALFDKLVTAELVHASPLEHQAKPDYKVWMPFGSDWAQSHLHGNLTGWVQFRKMIPNEVVRETRAA